MYVIEQETIQSSIRRDIWSMKRMLTGALLERSRGVTRQMRSDLHRRFAAAWTWVREEDAFALVESALVRGGLDKATVSAERRRGVDHLVFLVGLGWGSTGTSVPFGGATGHVPMRVTRSVLAPGSGHSPSQEPALTSAVG